ncbi:MAG: energy transducer TonB [Pseudomonadales bacterium]
MPAITINPRDRLAFTLFLAASLHAAVILGVSFSGSERAAPVPTIEVTLAQRSDLQAPEEADFIAQANQLGSGTEQVAEETKATSETDFLSDEPQPIAMEQVQQVAAEVRAQRELLSTTIASDERLAVEEIVPEEQVEPLPNLSSLSYDDLAREIASLEARIAEEQQADANRPRVKRLTSVSAKSADEAAYLNAWRQKVERIGNANYPAGGMSGSLRMLVVLRFDGALEEVRLLESSGHPLLDEAALRIVRLAAPYQAFNVEMRKKYDRLEIIRTWQFSRSGARLDS